MDRRQERRQSGIGMLAHALVVGGILLLIVGGFLAYPFVSSRLVGARVREAPVITPSHVETGADTMLPSAPALASPEPSAAPVEPTVGLSPTPSPPPTRPTRIVISKIGVDAPVIAVGWKAGGAETGAAMIWEVPDETASGWHKTSAPLGVAGNTVLNGHNTTHGEVFRDLYRLAAGDSITVYSGDVPFTYTVSEILILPEAGQPLEVRQMNARYIEPTTDERLTLVTCHPYGSLLDRLVIVAAPENAGASQ